MLSRSERHRIADILAPFAGDISQVGLFGSRATGSARPNSDIDLVLYGSIDQQQIDRLWTLFDDSDLSVTVDVIAYEDTMYPPLRRHIDETARIIFFTDANAKLTEASAP